MSEERVQIGRWTIWWIYGISSQSNECKCAQDRMKIRKGEIIGSKILVIQSPKESQPSFNPKVNRYFYKSYQYVFIICISFEINYILPEMIYPLYKIDSIEYSNIFRFIQRQNIRKKEFRFWQNPETSKKNLWKIWSFIYRSFK